MKYPPLPTDDNPPPKGFLDVFRYSRRALELVWTTSARLALIFAVLTVVAGVLPAAVAWIGQLIVDGVVAAMGQHQASSSADVSYVMWFVAAEAGWWRCWPARSAASPWSATPCCWCSSRRGRC